MWKITVQARWNKQPDLLELQDAKQLLGAYPKIQSKFVQDLRDYAKNQGNYVIESALHEIRTPADVPAQADNWLLIWGIDGEGRPYYLLVEKEQAGYYIAGIGPGDFAIFVAQTGKTAIGPILALLASPSKMKALVVYVSHQKPPTWKPQDALQSKKPFLQWAQSMWDSPNVDGQWFPNFSPKCPVCNAQLVGLSEYRVGFGQMVCPRCGYKLE